MKLIQTIDKFIAKIEQGILILFIFLMISIGSLQVVLRNVFNSGIEWADVFIRHMVLWVGLIGASLATQNQKHLNMDALSRVMSPKLNAIVSIILNLIAGVVSGFFVIGAFYFMKAELGFENNEMIDLTEGLDDSSLDEGLLLDEDDSGIDSDGLLLDDDPTENTLDDMDGLLLDDESDISTDDDLLLDDSSSDVDSEFSTENTPVKHFESLIPGVPLWAGQMIIPVAFSLISIRFFLKAIEGIIRVVNNDFTQEEKVV